MALDHKAIFKAYPSVVTIDDGKGAFDVNGNPVSIEQSNIDAARATLNTELSAVQYKNDRVGGVGIGTTVYASYGDQLDMIYKDLVNGTFTTSGTWATHIKDVKDTHPKPS